MKFNDPAEIDVLVLRFQEGDGDAGAKLVEAYAPYISRYMNLLAGQIDYRNRTDRWFISLFVKDPEVKRVLRRKRMGQGFGKAAKVAGKAFGVVVEVVALYDSEDLYHDMVYEFLAIAKKYRPYPGKHFGAYLLASFPYKVVNIVKRLGRNPTMYNIPDIIRYNDDQTAEIYVPEELWVYEDYSCDEDNDSGLGLRWLSGELCSDLFATLTKEERQIIKLRYLDGFTDSIISSMLGVKFSHVKQVRLSAIEKLQKGLEENAESNTDD